MEATECGAASLSIILSYYGKYLPLEELRMACGVSRDGSNALNLIRAAEKYGLKGQGFQKTGAELLSIDFPAIIFWEFNHFLVLEGFKKNRVYLNDPATGPRYISYEEFEKSYSGVVLMFGKETHFAQGGKPSSLLKQLYQRLKSVSNPVSFIFTTGVCLLLPGFALPAFVMVFLNTFFSMNIIPWKWGFLGAIFGVALFSGILTWFRQYCLNRLNTHLSMKFSSDFLWHLLKLPLSFYTQRFSGEIAYRTILNDEVAEILTGSILSATVDLLLIVFYGFLMLVYDAAIGWIGILAAFFNLIFLFFIYRSRINTYACLQQDMAKYVRESIGGLQNIEAIKAKGAESDFFSKWAGHYTNTVNKQQEIGKKDLFLTAVPIFFQLLASAVLLGVGSLRIIEGSLTIGMVMALQLLQINFLQPIQRFVGFNQLLQNMSIGLDRLNDILKNPVDRIYCQTKISPKQKVEGYLEFRKVTFGYAPLGPPLIESLSFTVKPGERLAFVGPTGSGKSTIAKLASGLFQPWSGEILYDGVPIEEIAREVLYHSIATVDQEIFLFSGTIRDNLTLWNSKIPDEMVFSATQDAAIHEEILLRLKNYDSLLLEGGRNLSGGQRQRLEIARALLYEPSFLILDEATSALDSKTEQEIMEKIKKRNCSVLMIAHRLSTIQDCDEIIVLDKGKILEKGKHHELKSSRGLYRDLILSEVSI